MDANDQYELYLIKKELQSIIDELSQISTGVRQNFSGIGNDKCANVISSAASHYRDVKAQLDRMDLSALSDEFLAKKREEEKRALAQVQKQVTAMTTGLNKSNTTTTNKQSTQKAAEESAKQLQKAAKSAMDLLKEALPWLFR